ncbi:P-loop containing nucleoside triphosphate hydrolase protein [Biscogniauxia mediterranea]|nr:P-loop containing nucleoside triphosphate hydrolase protein [Biscogniauxia mediterranea]
MVHQLSFLVCDIGRRAPPFPPRPYRPSNSIKTSSPSYLDSCIPFLSYGIKALIEYQSHIPFTCRLHTMSSVAWSEEETRYFRALLSWDPSKAIDDSVRTPHPLYEKPPAGEFRILIVGAKGCGKTSLLTRFRHGTFPRRPEHEHGCRHRILVESRPYVLDFLEFPSELLPANPGPDPGPDPQSAAASLAQAVRITDAAILVYDVRRRDSFALLRGLHDVICRELGIASSSPGFHRRKRDYALALVGTKRDSDSDSDDEHDSVSWAEGYKLAQGFRVRGAFAEASARTGENIDGLFAQLGRELVRLLLRGEDANADAGADAGADADSLMTADTTETAGIHDKSKKANNKSKNKKRSGGGTGGGSSKTVSRWRSWTGPCFRG